MEVKVMNKKGITLVELLIVVAIVGILAMVAIPAYVGQQTRATRTEAYTNLQSLRVLEEQYFAENGSYASLTSSLPGFQPGSNLSFNYALTNVTGKGLPASVPIPYDNTPVDLTPNTTPCFIAKATGIAGSRVEGDVFAIDCQNRKNF